MDKMILIEKEDTYYIIGGNGDDDLGKNIAWMLGRLLGKAAKELYDLLTGKKSQPQTSQG